MTAAEYAAGLRGFADWIDQHPDLGDTIHSIEAKVYPPDSPEDVRTWALAMGAATKDYSDRLFQLRRTFSGDHLSLTAVFWRDQVCRKVVTGTRHVEAEIIPERVIEAHDEEIVEWECDPILAPVDMDAAKDAMVLATIGEPDDHRGEA